MEVAEKPPEKTLGELFGALTDDLKNLVQQEARLARVEVQAKLLLLTQNLGMLAIGAGVLYAGFLVALFGAVAYLNSAGVPAWQGGALIALLALGVGGGLAVAGLGALKNMSLVPGQTITTLKEDAKWLKEQTGRS